MTNSNAILQERRLKALPKGLASVTPFYVDRAVNAELWDMDGNRYLDFAVGIAVCNTGHCHPAVVKAAKAQLDRVTHTCAMVVMYDVYVELAEKINDIVPIGDARSVFFNSGAEAIENAVKVARTATKRPGIITLRGGYHGRTALTSTMNGKIAPYRVGHIGGQMPNIFHALAPMEPHGVSVDDAIESLRDLFKVEIEAEQTAAIIVEPVLGEGGFYKLPDDYMRRLRALCDEHGILLVFDEVQTGFGRTGKMFASEHSGVEPDLMAIAKAMGGGLPISGLVGKAEIMDAVPAGGLGGTYSGNPVSCAASIAAIDVIVEEGLAERANDIGNNFKEAMEKLKHNNPKIRIGDVRANGAMCALELVSEAGTNKPNPTLAPQVVTKARELGLVILSCGYYGNCIRVLPPLTVPDAHLAEGLDILVDALMCVAG